MISITPIVVHREGFIPDRSAFPDCTLFVSDEGQGKKHALHKAVKSLEQRERSKEQGPDYVWFLDDDVLNANELWEELRQLDLESADLIILPLCMRAGAGSLLERLQQLEYIAIQALTLRQAERQRAVMCSGANLIVRRERWLESYKDLHLDLPSGDDMFLLESFKRRKLNIKASTDVFSSTSPLCAEIMPVANFRSFLRQRMRWAGKAAHYQDKDIRRCGAMVAMLNILSVICPPCWLIKFGLEYTLIRKARKSYPSLYNHYNKGQIFAPALLLSLIYPFYMLACLLGGILHQHRW